MKSSHHARTNDSIFAFTALILFGLVYAGAATVDDRPAQQAEAPDIPTIDIGRDVHGSIVRMPLVGSGTWQYNDTIAYQSLCKAFAAGSTFVDTAFGYQNEHGVRNALADCYTGRREDLFVLTKVPGGLTRAQTLDAHHQNMFLLNLEYVDHLMTHFPADWKQTHASKHERQEEWRALEEIYYSGKARSIGISHYCPQHIHDILEIATVMPSINQVEYHVGSQDIDGVIDTCREHGITFMSFSPLCGPCEFEPKDSLINGDLVASMGMKYNVTGAQVALRFIVQQALKPGSFIGGVIPKSNNVKHIQQNMDLFSFELSKEDMDLLGKATKPGAEGGDCGVPFDN